MISNWRDEASCAACDPEMWFPNKNVSRSDTRFVKRICGDCPVKMQCLTEAINGREEYGIWGGSTPDERRRLWRQIRPPKTVRDREHAPCGTNAGYVYHIRWATPACGQCREAHRQYRIQQRRKARS